MINTYMSYQLITRDIGQSLLRVGQQPMVQRDTEYYLANIGKVTTAEEFVNDHRLFNYAMKAHGLEDMAYAKAFMLKALNEGIDDPNSFANKLTDKRYADFVRAYNFAAHGASATTYNQANQGATKQYLERATPVGTGVAELYAYEADYYSRNISNITSIDQFLHADNERLLAFALEAYGLEAHIGDKALLREMLEGGTADPESPANSHHDFRWSSFVGAFDFAGLGERATVYNQANHGVTDRFLDLITSGGGTPDEAALAETAYYTQNIGRVASVNGFMLEENGRLLLYALQAFGLEDSFDDKELIREMLEGGIASSSSPANTHEDGRWAEFVSTFNFDIRGARTTTYTTADHGTTQRYLIRKPILGAPAPTHVQEALFYSRNIGSITSIDQFLHKDNERLLDFALRAFRLDDAIGDKKLIREMLEGGIANPDSPANKHDDEGWIEFVKAFNFADLGEKATTHSLALQPSVDKFVRQTMEENAGAQNEGVRLALYFERMAESLTNVYEILADRALATVVRTALGLPDSIAQLDVDKQAKLIEDRLDFEDFTDPVKLEKFITRFTTMWELNNPTASPQSMVLSLFQPPEFGVSPDTLMAIAMMKR